MEPLKIWETGEATITKEKTIRRFTTKNLIQGFLETFELDKGILYTVIGLFKYPGKIIRDYLDTDRITITSPIRYFLFVVGISAYLTIKYDFWVQQSVEMSSSKELNLSPEQAQLYQQEFTELYQTVFLDYLSLWFAVAVFFVSLFSYLFFKKSKFTYWEQFIANLFIFNQNTLIFLPFILFAEWFDTYSLYMIYLLVGYVYSIWAYKDLFGTSWGVAILKGLLIQTLGTVLFFGIFSIALTFVLFLR